MGHQDCSTPCTISSLAIFDSVDTIQGSVTIQCCHSLSMLTLFPALRSFNGNLRIYYNRELTRISGLALLESIQGFVSISQNTKLMEIDGFGALRTISGYLAIEYNQALVRFSGFNQLSTIGGQQLSSGHGLIIRYNMNLTNLAGLSGLQTLSYGTVHIEGNIALCYAGYPTWSVGSYAQRLDDATSGIDRGIDWRSKLSRSEEWQYTWGVAGGGYPSLYIRDNAQECGKQLIRCCYYYYYYYYY